MGNRMLGDTSRLVDPFLEMIPDSQLSGFDRLPLAEQKWRARIYVATYMITGSAPFSWAIAIDEDAEEVFQMKKFLAETPDRVILAGPRFTERSGAVPGLDTRFVFNPIHLGAH